MGAEHVAAVKVEIKSGPAKAGLKDIEGEGKRVAGSLKAALSDAMSEGLKGAKNAAKGLLSDIKGVVSTAGTILGGVGTAELVKGALEAGEKYRGLAAGIRFAGGTAKDAAAAQDQAKKSAIAWGQDSMKVVDAFDAIREETGSIEFAQQAIDTVSEAARGAHKSLDGVQRVTGTLNEKFGITAKELPDALADVVGLSEKGGVSFEDMSEKLGLIGAYAKEAGLQGRSGLGQIVGMLNLADNSTGSFKKGISAVGGLLEQLSTTVGKSKIGAALGVSQKDLGGNAAQQIEAIMRATKGQKSQLEKAFGGEQLKLLVDLGKTYGQAFDSTKGDVKTKTAAGAAALRDAFAAASKSTVTWTDIQREAASEMQQSPQKIATATEKLRQAFQSEQVQAAISKLADKLPALAEFMAKVATWTVDNPGAAITTAILGSIAKAGIGDAVGSLLKAGFEAMPWKQIASSLMSAQVGLGLLVVAATAAAMAISDYETKMNQEQEKLDATPELVKKAKAELAQTGGLSEDTMNALAQRSADFAGMKKATETGGVTDMSYAAIVAGQAGRMFGGQGTDEVALSEAKTRMAAKLGAQGVTSQGAELDALIAQGVAAKRAAQRPGETAPGFMGTPAPGGAPSGPHVDMNTLAQLQGQAAGRGAADGLKGQVIQVRVVGGNGPTAGGAVTAGTAPR